MKISKDVTPKYNLVAFPDVVIPLKLFPCNLLKEV
jgi:hypothetical protein